LWQKKITITVRVEGPGTATVNGETAVTVPQGTALTFVATPAEGATFIGWDISLPSTAEVDGIYTAIFLQSWTVSFDLDGGTGTFVDQIVKDGDKATKPFNEPTKDGCVFNEWNFDFTQAIHSNVTVKALWKKMYKITVKKIGAGAATVNGKISVTVEGGTALAFEPIPAEGYKLSGWDVDPLPATAEADGTYTVTFLKNTWTVSFDLDGGTGTFPDQIVKDGEKAIEPLDIPVKDGYTFESWRFDFNQAINSDVTVKAVWIEDDKITVTVKVEGKGTATVNGETSVTVEEGTELNFNAVPEDGYVFDHWNVSLPKTATESATYTVTFIEPV
jgi:hypothetical protein